MTVKFISIKLYNLTFVLFNLIKYTIKSSKLMSQICFLKEKLKTISMFSVNGNYQWNFVNHHYLWAFISSHIS